jgi:hypothetical protein
MVAKRVSDQGILREIRSFLTAGVLPMGWSGRPTEGRSREASLSRFYEHRGLASGGVSKPMRIASGERRESVQLATGVGPFLLAAPDRCERFKRVALGMSGS